jgi:hypothetical protein
MAHRLASELLATKPGPPAEGLARLGIRLAATLLQNDLGRGENRVPNETDTEMEAKAT